MSRPFQIILIANRGEIACRIIGVCRDMGIESVAVYSDFDRDASHVHQADVAVRIGPPAPRDSYLNIDAILAAARRTGADAIHPGYGFLAESADFAARCEEARIAFIGPRSDVIRALGSKENARHIAEEVGVPVVPSSPTEFPLLIKASAGGGGRGMRIVRDPAELDQSAASARREAERAFGDGTLLYERYIKGARHVEIQIFGDHHGDVMHLYERDCSIQRRHQKIIEESPSPALTPELRQRMCDAALALARKVGYTNAGTVEFLLAPDGAFYFIEVNTRIQVEHPVTEAITALDLVRMQIEIAEGAPLRKPLGSAGHAIEARLYAEGPANDFLPSTGTLDVWRLPSIAGVRIATGAREGDAIGVYYDPLLAKVISRGRDRESAIRQLTGALRQFAVQGVETNREFLISVLESEEFRAGRAHTGTQFATVVSTADDELLATLVAIWIERTEHARREILPSIPPGFRNNPYREPRIQLAIGDRTFDASTRRADIAVIAATSDLLDVEIDGIRQTYCIVAKGDDYHIRSSSQQRTVRRLPRYPCPASAGHHETANSPMPGQVLRILVAEGQAVKPGDPLVVLEAMKMEQTIKTTIHGMVAQILVKTGDVVAPGQMLVEIQSLEESDGHTGSRGANN